MKSYWAYHVYVKGLEVTVVDIPYYSEISGYMGLAVLDKNMILIDSSLSDYEYIWTLQHEMAHFSFLRDNVRLTEQMEEVIVESPLTSNMETFTVVLEPREMFEIKLNLGLIRQ